jgi:hypothetical protein
MNSTRRSVRRKLAVLLTLTVLINWLAPAIFSNGSTALAMPSEKGAASSQPAPDAIATDFVRQIPLSTKDIVYDKNTKKIYASIPGFVPNRGNSLTQVDPATGAVGGSVFIGSEPGKLTISDNGQYIYSTLDGASAIRRFDVAAQTAGLQFAIASTPYDMAVLPGKPESIAVTTGTVAIYDNEVRRQTVASNPNFSAFTFLDFSSTADTLYATSGGGSYLNKISVTPGGASVSTSTAISGPGSDFRYDNGRIYLAFGQVLDAATGTLLGTFPGLTSNALVLPDSAAGRVYFLTNGSNGSL